MRDGDAAHFRQHVLRFDQPALVAARQVHLSRVAGHDRLRAEADTRKEHLHLLGRGVLRLVENDERVVQRAAAHVGERRDFDHLALEHLRGLVEAEQIVERVVERAQVRIDLLREIAGQKAEPLARFDGRARQHDALDLIALQRIHGAGDGEIRLARAGRPDAERHVVRDDLLQILALHRRPATQVGAARVQRRAVIFVLAEIHRGARLVERVIRIAAETRVVLSVVLAVLAGFFR